MITGIENLAHTVLLQAHINQVCWVPKCNSANLLLAANDKTIKLWRVAERRSDKGSGEAGVAFCCPFPFRLHLIHQRQLAI